MSIIFGPVASRRFGSSLGIDLSPNVKCCNFDCLYCELAKARATEIITNPPSVDNVIKDLKTAISSFGATDTLTLTANGEPTLYPHLKELISEINKLKTTQKTLILSNGSGTMNPRILESLKELDIVKFSLDSVVAKTFRKIDRSLKSIDLEELIKNMAEFSKTFKGELVMESLILDGINDSEDELKALNDAFSVIKPARVDISTLDRPPAHEGAKAISEEKLRYLASFITAAPVFVATRNLHLEPKDLSKDEILKLLALRPQSKNDVAQGFSALAKKNLDELLNTGKVKIQSCANLEFYKVNI